MKNYFLPENYASNPGCSADSMDKTFWSDTGITAKELQWQIPVYRYIRKLSLNMNIGTTIDIGSGPGFKSHKFLSQYTNRLICVDQDSAIKIGEKLFKNIEWVSADLDKLESKVTYLARQNPSLITLIDVVEHVDNPISLLNSLLNCMSANTILAISTPDRDLLEGALNNGPPHNLRHVREWSHKEMHSLLEYIGFSIIETKHVLPRSYRITLREIARLLVRFLLLKAVPDKHYGMVFICKKRHSE